MSDKTEVLSLAQNLVSRIKKLPNNYFRRSEYSRGYKDGLEDASKIAEDEAKDLLLKYGSSFAVVSSQNIAKKIRFEIKTRGRPA